jgi:hypothetical protein
VVSATIHKWAVSLGKNEKTLQSLFTRAGKSLPAKGSSVSAADVFYVLFGDEYAEKLRGLKQRNDEAERESDERMGKLVDVDQLKAWCVQWFGGVRQAIDAAPDTVSKEWANKVFVPAVMKMAEEISKLPKPKKDTEHQ